MTPGRSEPRQIGLFILGRVVATTERKPTERLALKILRAAEVRLKHVSQPCLRATLRRDLTSEKERRKL